MATKAHFAVCTCGQHGRIVVDGRPGEEVYLQRVARIAAFCAYERRLLTKAQAEALGEQINASRLCRKADEVDQALMQHVHTWNATRRTEDLNPLEFHAFFERRES